MAKEKEKPLRCGDCKNCNPVNYGRGIPVCYMIHTDPSGRPQIAETPQKTDAEMDAELLEVEQKLAEIESPHQPSQDERDTFFDEEAVAAMEASVSGLAINQDHYNASGAIQPIEAMQANMTRERFIGFCQGNCIKYSCRAGRKDDEAKRYCK